MPLLGTPAVSLFFRERLMPSKTTISCLRCGRRNKITKIRETLNDSLYRCGACGALFDANPDEGGTHSDGNPAARLEREDRERERRVKNLGKRRWT